MTSVSGKLLHFAYWIVVAVGLALALWLSPRAFDKPLTVTPGKSILPMYLTQPSRYEMGKAIFFLLTILVYVIIVFYSPYIGGSLIYAVVPDIVKSAFLNCQKTIVYLSS